MNKRIAIKILIPMGAVIISTTMIVCWIVVRQIGARIESVADEQIQGRLRATRENLLTVNELSLDKVRAAMRAFTEECKVMGNPSIGRAVHVGSESVPDLLFGGRPQANNFASVDHVKSVMAATATIFVKRGEDFIRITTNVTKPDGARAIGTPLDPNGKAMKAIRDGSSFYGVVDILGKAYMTGYEPIRDAKGETIGIWYVGYPLSALEEFGRSVAQARILDKGFVAFIDPKGKVVFKSDNAGAEDVTKILSQHDAAGAGWVVKEEVFAPWGYKTVAAYPNSDIADRYVPVYAGAIAASAGIGVLLFCVTYVLLTRVIVRPVKQVVERMNNADLNTAFNTETTDEIGDLQRAFDGFVRSIRTALLRVADVAEAVAGASEHIHTTTDQMAAGAHEQTAQASEVAGAVEEMSASITENSTNAGNTAQLAHKAREVAERGGTAVNETVKGMKRIADVVNRSAETVRALGHSSSQIGEIIRVIDDIADQTNLLALNAAIEAARAGEQGRGFAVVADEVRKLAERTTRATKEIASMIKTIQNDTTQAVQSMEVGTKEVDQGFALADQAAGSLRGIVETSQGVTDRIVQIADASNQQSNASEQISKNIEAISSVTRDTASNIQEIAGAAEKLSTLTETLRELVNGFQLKQLSDDSMRDTSSPKKLQSFAGVTTRGQVAGSRMPDPVPVRELVDAG
jgi:methyl-accepting chemotaxis protein